MTRRTTCNPWGDKRCSAVRRRHGERGIWQRHFWEHLIRDDEDVVARVDCAHFYPVKHGDVADWPFSTLAACVGRWVYSAAWLGPDDAAILNEAWGE